MLLLVMVSSETCGSLCFMQLRWPQPRLQHRSLSVFHLFSWLGGFLLPPVVWNNRDGKKSLVYFLLRTGFHQGPLLLFWVRTRPLMWFPFDVFWLMLSNQSPFVSWRRVLLSVLFLFVQCVHLMCTLRVCVYVRVYVTCRCPLSLLQGLSHFLHLLQLCVSSLFFLSFSLSALGNTISSLISFSNHWRLQGKDFWLSYFVPANTKEKGENNNPSGW